MALSTRHGFLVCTAPPRGVALTMTAALTLLPAMLGFLGTRVLSRRQRQRIGRPQPERPD
jgi:putative drug exporter of the RND superfamily